MKNIPKDLRLQIKRYLDYNFEQKKDLKIEEEEAMGFLNDDLRGKLTVYLNGKILKSVSVFSEFPLEFLSHLTFILAKKSYTVEEYVFNEGDEDKDIYFITSGKVALIHKQTYSYVVDLEKEQSFGEIGFFSDCKRQVTVKSRDFTDVLTINLFDFLNIANNYSEQGIVILCIMIWSR
jgi:CRP-like cAMP-binding protein